MSTELTQEINSTSLDDTLSLARQIGERLKGGEVIELISDLGGGKTAFVRGLAAGMGSQDKVSSPSFTISNQYVGKDLTIHHFDFYRLDEPGIVQQSLEEIIDDPKAVVVIEWAGLVEAALPPNRLRIDIIPTGDESRQLLLRYPSNLSYLLENNT